MTFPRRVGFRAVQETQRGDLFGRATLANVLLDCAELPAAHEMRILLRKIATEQADYLAGAKLQDRHGGWSYFPDLPELPPDLDSLSSVMTLFARITPQHRHLCESALTLALSQADGRGGFATWLVSADDPPAAQRTMRQSIKRWWGSGSDVDVCANFFWALQHWDADRYRSVIEDGVDWLLRQQQVDGGWPASWYWGLFPSDLVLRALNRGSGYEQSEQRVVHGILGRQRPDGGWGDYQTTPLDTAIALWILMHADHHDLEDPMRRGLDCILELQTWNGYWKGSPWIKMNAGRARGGKRMLTYMSHTISTALCLRTVLYAIELELVFLPNP